MNSERRRIPIRSVVRQVETYVNTQADTIYRLLGVRWYGNGPFIREEVTTATSKATRLFPVRCGQFVYNRLFAWKGSFGVISADLDGCFVSGEFPLFEVDQSQLLVDYLFLYMNRPRVWESIEIESTGSTAASRNRWKEERFLDREIVLPSIAVQRRIIDLISSVDSYIDALQRQADATREARSVVLDEMLAAGGSDWTELTLGDLVSLEYGRPLKAEDRDGTGFPVFGSAGVVGLHSKPLVGEAPVIIVGRKGTAGAVWWSDLPCSVIDTAYFVVPKVETDPRFLFFLLGSLDLPSLNAQTGVPGLNRERAYSCRLRLPPLAEQQRIAGIVSAMDVMIEAVEQMVVRVKALRAGLLSDLLSGRHEIPESYDRLLGAA